MYTPIRKADLIIGGTAVKQGEIFTLGFQLFDVNGLVIVPTGGQTISVKVANKTGVVFETTAVVVGDHIEFTIDENIGAGKMRVELTVADGANVLQKYPADGYIELYITASLDDIGTGFIYTVTAAEMFTRIEDSEEASAEALQLAGGAVVTADAVRADFDLVVAEAGSSNPEVVLARGEFTTLEERLDDANQQLGEKGTLIELNKTKKEATYIAYNIENFGGIGDDIADDTNALIAVANQIQINGGGTILFPPNKTYKIFAPIGDELFAFVDINYFNIIHNGSSIRDAQTYVGGSNPQEAILFKFENSKNIKTDPGLKVSSQRPDVTLAGSVTPGLVAFRFEKGCENIGVKLDIDGAKRGVSFARTAADPTSYICKRINVEIKAIHVKYPYSAIFSGDHAVARIDAENCGRNFFIYGVKDVKIYVNSKNQKTTSLVKSYSGLGCEDILIYIYDRESTGTFPANPLFALHFGDSTPADMKNINLILNVDNSNGGWGNTLGFFKYLNGGSTVDTVGRGHKWDGLRVSGYSKSAPGGSHVVTNEGQFNSPDVVKNICFKDLTLAGTSSLSFKLGDTVDEIKVENVTSESHIYVESTVARTVFTKSKAANFTGATTNVSKHKYIDCEITSGTQQAYDLNKEFVNTLTPKGILNRIFGYGSDGYVPSTVRVTGDMSTGKNIFLISPSSHGRYKLEYFLTKVSNDINPSTRKEKFGTKSFTVGINSSGVPVIFSPIVDDIPERTFGAFTEPFTVELVTGSTAGAYLKVTCPALTGVGNTMGVFKLEALTSNLTPSITPIV